MSDQKTAYPLTWPVGKPHEPPKRSRYLHRLTIRRTYSNFKRCGHWATHC